MIGNASDPDADNVITSPMLSGIGPTINTYIDLVFLSGGEAMLADRVKNAPAAFLLAFGLLWFAFELIMRYLFSPRSYLLMCFPLEMSIPSSLVTRVRWPFLPSCP